MCRLAVRGPPCVLLLGALQMFGLPGPGSESRARLPAWVQNRGLALISYVTSNTLLRPLVTVFICKIPHRDSARIKEAYTWEVLRNAAGNIVNANADLAFFLKLFFKFPHLGRPVFRRMQCHRWQGTGARDGADVRRGAVRGSGAPGRCTLSLCDFL